MRIWGGKRNLGWFGSRVCAVVCLWLAGSLTFDPEMIRVALVTLSKVDLYNNYTMTALRYCRIK